MRPIKSNYFGSCPRNPDTYSSGTYASTQYLHQNALFSIYAIADASAIITNAWEYDSFGNSVMLTDGNDGDSLVNFSSNDDRASNGRPWSYCPGYTGQFFDAETGWHYYKHRHYDSASGRFASRDKIIGVSQAAHMNIVNMINLYLYNFDNPLSYTDPYGLYSKSPIECERLLNKIIANMENIKHRIEELFQNSNNLPFFRAYPGEPNRASQVGHIAEIVQRYLALLKYEQDYFDNCTDPPKPCPDPQPQAAPSRQSFFEKYWKEMAAAAGAGGVGFWIYVTISEGSRIILPIRNFVPIM